MRIALIAAALLALVLCGCSSEPSQEVTDTLANMESELVGMEKELAEFKALVGNLKSELSDCTDEMQAMIQEKMQEQAAAADELLEEAPVVPDHPTEHPTSELPVKALE